MKSKQYLHVILLIIPLLFVFGCANSNYQTQLKFGITAAQSDLWDEAIFRWKKVVANSPDSAQAHNNLAVAFEKKGLRKEAEKEYLTAIKLDPKNDYIKSNFDNFKKNPKDEKREKDEKK